CTSGFTKSGAARLIVTAPCCPAGGLASTSGNLGEPARFVAGFNRNDACVTPLFINKLESVLCSVRPYDKPYPSRKTVFGTSCQERPKRGPRLFLSLCKFAVSGNS